MQPDLDSAVKPDRLSFVICTVRPEKCVKALESLSCHSRDDEIIIIVDGTDFVGQEPMKSLASLVERLPNVRLITHHKNLGLSFCRNEGIAFSANKYIVFLDDDVRLTHDIVSRYKDWFALGYSIVGGPLVLPKSYPPPPKWLPQGLTSLLGIHSRERKIWGGNFGFVRDEVWSVSPFRAELGRKGNGLQSGDDTTFIRQVMERPGAAQVFDPELQVEHHIDLQRYSMSYLMRRSFWQGRSEVRRRSVLRGLGKEARRAMELGSPRRLAAPRAAVGALLFGCTVAGALMEYAQRKRVET